MKASKPGETIWIPVRVVAVSETHVQTESHEGKTIMLETHRLRPGLLSAGANAQPEGGVMYCPGDGWGPYRICGPGPVGT